MIINYFILGINPFFTAYYESDWIGKAIFLSLLILSIACWTVLIYKFLANRKALQSSLEFRQTFERHKGNPLAIPLPKNMDLNPFLSIYSSVKKHTLDILNKNRKVSENENQPTYLSRNDIEFVDSHTIATITHQMKHLEKNLYILSTIVALAPFLGLLGTVWGILDAFTDLQTQTGNTSQIVLGGLSLALTTTVLGLIDAIPALIGYNYLKYQVRDLQMDMESFATEVLASVELQYRKVDL